MRWNNWSGRHQANPDKLAFVRSEADAAALVRQCQNSNVAVRVAGAGHSHSPLVSNDGAIIDISGLAGVLSVNPDEQTAWVRAGSAIYALGAQLHEHGLALKNQGDIDRQLISGAISTGTHGTGKQLQNLSAGVVALQIILGDGQMLQCSAAEHPDLFQVARLGLGGVGLITRVCMALGPSTVLQEGGFKADWEELIPQVPGLIDDNERFEFFWYPQSDEAVVKTMNPVDRTPVYPVADEGERCAFSFEVLPNHRPHLHTEMEYSVPRQSGMDCLADIRALLKRDFPEVVWPVEYRTIAGDDIWLSMASGRDSVSISVHQDVRLDESDYYQACEEIFLSYDGRPHWGKVNYLGGQQLEQSYAHWEAWWRARDLFDPGGTFLNAYLRGIRP